MGILEKHAQDNWFDKHYDKFEEYLETTGLSRRGIPPYLLVRSNCLDCNESVTAIRYHGKRIQIVLVLERWILHQCPIHTRYEIGPEEGQPEPWPDQGWSDPGVEPPDFADDPYARPDIPYVDPTKE